MRRKESVQINTYTQRTVRYIDWNNIYNSFRCGIKMQILLLELKITRCSGLQILSQPFRAYKRVFAWISIVSEIFNFSEPAKLGYRRAFNPLKHKKSIHNFIDQNAYCSDLQHINPSISENIKKNIGVQHDSILTVLHKLPLWRHQDTPIAKGSNKFKGSKRVDIFLTTRTSLKKMMIIHILSLNIVENDLGS